MDSSPIIASSSLQHVELSQQWREMEEVLSLHSLDPVAALEVWKAMSRSALPASLGTDMSRALEKLNPDRTADLRQSTRGVLSPVAFQKETAQRLHRSSHYPQNKLLMLDDSFAGYSLVELRRTFDMVVQESKRFEADAKKWRSLMDRTTEVPSLERTTTLHQLEEELMDAKVEDLRMRADAAKKVIETQRQKIDLLTRQCIKVLGDDFYGDVPPVQTADDLMRLVKSTQLEIRDTRFLLDQQRQTRTRALQRAQKKVAKLVEDLDQKRATALAEARRTHPVEAERRAALELRRERRNNDLVQHAVDGIVATETQSRQVIVDMLGNAMKILRADFQIALLTLAKSPSSDLSAARAFDVPQAGLAQGRRRAK
jgi:hypothetical protein